MAFSIMEEPGEYGMTRSPIFFYVHDLLFEDNESFYYVADIYVWSGALSAKPATPNLRLSRYPDAKGGAAFDVSDVCNSFLDDHTPREAGALFTSGVGYCYVELGWIDNDGEHLDEDHSDTFAIAKGWSKYTDGVNYDPQLESFGTGTTNRWLTDRHTTIRVFDTGYFSLSLPYKTKDYGIYKVKFWDDAGNTYLIDIYSLIGTADNSNERILNFPCGLNSWLVDNTDLGSVVAFNTKLSPVNKYYCQGINNAGAPVTKTFTFEIVHEDPWSFYTLQFLNRYGVWDYIVCEGRKKMNLQIESQEVFRNPLRIDVPGGISVDTARGQYTTEVLGREGFVLNTGWMNEIDNELIRQLMMSKRVVYAESDGKTYQPLNVKMTSFEEKTQQGEKLINYELTLNHANDYINSVK